MRIFTIVFLFFGLFASAQTFVFTVKVDPNTPFRFRITPGAPVSINWGDGQVDNDNNQTNHIINHNYTNTNVQIYQVFVSGSLDSFVMIDNNEINITNWGTNQWKTMANAFNGVDNLTISASSPPDLSQVTDMNRMFKSSTNFNSDISNWDVSNVTYMTQMFRYAENFNQPLNGWDVSNVIDMQFMFSGALAFDQPLDNWDVSSVTNLSSMFENASVFNQSIDNWNVSNVTEIGSLFDNAISFNQPLNSWDVSSITNMGGVFFNAQLFNQPLDNWDVSNVTFMGSMFNRAFDFNQPLDGWDVSNVTFMLGMFKSAGDFNQPLNNWDVFNVTTMREMFNATTFNQPLNNWDVSNVLSMEDMFSNAISFNQDLSQWNFNPNVDISGVNGFIAGSGLDANNYDALLRQFLNLNLPTPGPFFRATSLEYCDTATRNQLGWNFINDAPSSNCTINTLNGLVQYDSNNNGCDPMDIAIDNFPIEVTHVATNTVFNFYTSNGQYSPNIPDGTYTVIPQFDNPSFTISPTNTTVTITNGVAVTQDFCVTAIVQANDLEIVILPVLAPRPGFDTVYKLIYKNKGLTTLSGSIDFTYEDDYMDFLIATPAATTSSVGSLNWSFSNLNPFETREIEFSMNLNTPTDPNFPLNLNDILNFNATINPIANDALPLDNVFDLQQTVVNSFDPNDKTCLQGETIAPSEVGEYVHYRIRFENEGTANAIMVKIIDYIDTAKYDISTLVPLSASHDYTTKITEGNKVEFQFDNINLPFTAPASQGYVLFKIKTLDTLVLGDDFSNQAEIYFDFNAPIITNLETTAVAVPASITDRDLFQLQLVPNPANSLVTISSKINFQHITIYNTSGQVVFNNSFSSSILSHTLELENLPSGLYFVEISNTDHKALKKLLKQ